MAAKPLPDQALLLKLLRYEPETGKLFWRERTPEFFPYNANRSSIDQCTKWNSRLSGKPALNAIHDQGYRRGSICGTSFFAHRIIWRMVTGIEPEFIDHINGDRSDNRWINLRSVSKRENSMNCRLDKRNITGCHGVTWNMRKNRWQVRMTVSGKIKALGYFEDLDEAIRTRRAAEREVGFHPNHGDRPALDW